ncbi:MAG: sensor histidine kinase [Thermomicrobiales bacterium]
MTTTAAAAEPTEQVSFFRRIAAVFGRQFWLNLVFLLLSFPIGLTLFVVIVTTGATGLALIITIIGLPVLAMTALTWRGGAMLERWRVRIFLGLRIPEPYRPNPHYSVMRRLRAYAGDPAVWRDLLYTLLLFPLGVAEFTLVVVLVSIPLSLILVPVAVAFGQDISYVTWAIDSWVDGLPIAFVGLIIAFPAAILINLLAAAHRELARMLLGPSRRDALQQRVNTLSRTRASVVEAMLSERRRIERDLHDGVQQQLVHLAMSLGMARDRIDSDPAGAKVLVAEAHEEAKQTISDLRNTVRGIHPAVLTDRGLDAAVSAVAGNSPIPTTVTVDLPGRFLPIVESTAYFVVVEALTNIVKHAEATEVSVSLTYREPDMLVVTVRDNGKGGADPANGTGLIGLASRVEALDGSLSISSPAGGPTTLKAVIPCGSL